VCERESVLTWVAPDKCASVGNVRQLAAEFVLLWPIDLEGEREDPEF
jgi:hypothetical protein